MTDVIFFKFHPLYESNTFFVSHRMYIYVKKKDPRHVHGMLLVYTNKHIFCRFHFIVGMYLPTMRTFTFAWKCSIIINIKPIQITRIPRNLHSSFLMYMGKLLSWRDVPFDAYVQKIFSKSICMEKVKVFEEVKPTKVLYIERNYSIWKGNARSIWIWMLKLVLLFSVNKRTQSEGDILLDLWSDNKDARIGVNH